MKKNQRDAKVIILFVLFFVGLPLHVQSRVDWQETGNIRMEETPIDVARAQEGDYTYILTKQGSIRIYGVDGSLSGEIPVDPSVDSIAVSSKGDQLYLISSDNNWLKIIDISFVEDINITGSPFLGPADAKVAVVVFSDFQ